MKEVYVSPSRDGRVINTGYVTFLFNTTVHYFLKEDNFEMEKKKKKHFSSRKGKTIIKQSKRERGERVNNCLPKFSLYCQREKMEALKAPFGCSHHVILLAPTLTILIFPNTITFN